MEGKALSTPALSRSVDTFEPLGARPKTVKRRKRGRHADADKRTDGPRRRRRRVVPAGKCEGGGREDSERRSPPPLAACAPASLPFSLPLPFSSSSPSRPPSISQFGWLPPTVSSSNESEEREGGGRVGGGSGGEGNQDSRRDERRKVCSPRVHYLSLV